MDDDDDGMMQFYKLVGKEPVACSMLEWSIWFDAAFHAESGKDSRLVRHDEIGPLTISTVFIGASLGATCILFETMVRNEQEIEHEERCNTWEEAEACHARAVAAARKRVQGADKVFEKVLGGSDGRGNR